MKNKLLLVLLSIALISSCVAPSTTLVMPDNKRVVICSYSGWGIAGITNAQDMHDNCVASLISAGALPLTESGMTGIQSSSEESSVRILKVESGSPADLAGIKSGDTIVAIDGIPVNNWDDAKRLLFGRANTPVKVTFHTSGEDKTANLTRIPRTSE